MRELTPYGDGLSVLITCDNRPCHDWMSFIAWYSIRQALPDSKVAVSCRRGCFEMLKWCPRQRVPYFFHSEDSHPLLVALGRAYVDEPLLILPPEVTVHEPLPEDLMTTLLKSRTVDDLSVWCSEAKNPSVMPFCSIADGCGPFHPTKWIDRSGNPLGYSGRFLKGDLTASERKVFNLWYKAVPLYDNIG